MVIGVVSGMAPAAGVGGAGYAMVISRRLRNSFVRLLDRELCPFQVRGGAVGRLSSSSIAPATFQNTISAPPVGHNNPDQKMYALAKHIINLLTDALNALGVCRIPIGMHCIGVPCHSEHYTARHYG